MMKNELKRQPGVKDWLNILKDNIYSKKDNICSKADIPNQGYM